MKRVPESWLYPSLVEGLGRPWNVAPACNHGPGLLSRHFLILDQSLEQPLQIHTNKQSTSPPPEGACKNHVKVKDWRLGQLAS